MTMQILETSHSQTGPFRWFTFERRNWIALVLSAGVMGFSWGNGHTTQDAVQNIGDQLGQKTVQVRQLKAVVGCEHLRAKTVEGLALQPKMVDPSDIPADCPSAPAAR